MKRTFIAVLLLAGLIAVPVMAQDFESPKPQIFSFSFGVPLGYDLDVEDIIAGSHFGLSITVVDNMEVGFETLAGANLIRLAYSFTDQFGAAIGYGRWGIRSAATLGIFGTFIQQRAANGIAYSLGIRVDYLADTDAFDSGRILFTPRMSFGL